MREQPTSCTVPVGMPRSGAGWGRSWPAVRWSSRSTLRPGTRKSPRPVASPEPVSSPSTTGCWTVLPTQRSRSGHGRGSCWKARACVPARSSTSPTPFPSMLPSDAGPERPGSRGAGNPGGMLIVIQVARFAPQKGQATTLRVVSRLRERLGDVRVLYVGEGSGEDAVKREAEPSARGGPASWVPRQRRLASSIWRTFRYCPRPARAYRCR